MKINKERTGCGLSIDSPVSPEVLRSKMNSVAECVTNAFVPSDVSWEGERYYFYISHRQSLKEYIYERGFKVKDFFAVFEAVDELFSKIEQNGIDGHEFIFDYECLFVGNSLLDLEFVYAPDGNVHREGKIVNNKCSDMFAILSLHIDYTEKEISGKKADEIAKLLESMSDWENGILSDSNCFPHEIAKSFINRKTNYYEMTLSYVKKMIFDIKNVICGIINKKEGNKMRLHGKMLLDGMDFRKKNEEINSVNIGRDKEWADIPLGMIFVSRKHATVYKNNDKWYVKDHNSKNGTFVDGVRIASDCPFDLKDGSEICFGLPETKLIFCLL